MKTSLVFLLTGSLLVRERCAPGKACTIQSMKNMLKNKRSKARTTHTKYVFFLLGTHRLLKCITKEVSKNWNESDSKSVKTFKIFWEKLQYILNKRIYWENVVLWMCLGICLIWLALSKLVISCQEIIKGYQKLQLHLVQCRAIVSKRRMVVSITLILC